LQVLTIQNVTHLSSVILQLLLSNHRLTMAITFPKTTVVRNMRTLCERKVRGTEAVLNITRAACPFVKTHNVLSKSLKTKTVLNIRL